MTELILRLCSAQVWLLLQQTKYSRYCGKEVSGGLRHHSQRPCQVRPSAPTRGMRLASEWGPRDLRSQQDALRKRTSQQRGSRFLPTSLFTPVSDPQRTEVLRAEILTLLHKGAVRQVPVGAGRRAFSPVTPPSPNGVVASIPSWICSPWIASHLHPVHFQILTVPRVREAEGPGDWFVTVDLKKAYFQVPTWQGHWWFLRFGFDRQLYDFQVLLFGTALAPGPHGCHGSGSPTRPPTHVPSRDACPRVGLAPQGSHHVWVVNDTATGTISATCGLSAYSLRFCLRGHLYIG